MMCSIIIDDPTIAGFTEREVIISGNGDEFLGQNGGKR